MRRVLVLIGVLAVMRMLMVAGGAVNFTPPEEPEPPAGDFFTVTDAPQGGWTQIQDPKAYYYNGKTYLAWLNGSDGAVYAASWDHSTETLSTPTLVYDLGGPDNHNSPSIMVRESDKRIIIAYSGHSTSFLRMSISTNPEDVSSFAASVNLDGQLGGSRYTYPVLYQLRGVANDPIYLFWRDIPSIISNTGRIAYSVSTDSGATWSARTLLFTGAADRTPYWRIVSDWDTRIDIFTTEREPASSTGLWHMYIDGSAGTYHTSDGTQITDALPLTVADLTLVEDNADGNLWSWGASWDGAPATVIMQENGESDNRIKVARWRAGAWQVDQVIANVGGQLGINKYGSGAGIHHADPDIVYFSRKIGGRWEVYRYTSADDGATWSGSALTSGSSVDHVWVDVPHFAAAGMSAIWLSGTYTNDTNYDFGISATP